MITVKFIQDYRGALTNEEHFKSGQEAEFPLSVADALIEAKRAVEVEQPIVEVKAKPKAAKKAKKK